MLCTCDFEHCDFFVPNVSIKNPLKVQAQQDVSVYSVDGNLELQAPQGGLELNSGNNITIKANGQGSIQLSQGGASIEIDAAGNLTIDATNITLSATNIAIKGSAISNN